MNFLKKVFKQAKLDNKINWTGIILKRLALVTKTVKINDIS